MNRPHGAEHARIRKAWQAAGLLPADRPRRGTPEQVRAFRQAKFDLDRQGEYESRLRTADGKRAIRGETPRSSDLNDRVGETMLPLSRFQRWWHFNRAGTEQYRDMDRMQRASGRQDRARRRESR
jgi:hypothetical protein